MHTPGRWHFNRHYGGQYHGDLTAALGNKHGVGYIRTIAVVLKYAGKEECEANAHLLTAAPSMFKFIERVRDYGRESGDDSLYRDADAVLADALGEKAATAKHE